MRRLFLMSLPLILITTGRGESLADEGPKKVESALNLNADVETLSVNFGKDTNAIIAWVKPIFDAIDKTFQQETRPRTIVFEATVHPDRPADISVSGRPALSDDETKAVLGAVDLKNSLKTRIVDCTIQITAKVNGGTPESSGPLVPPLPTVGDLKLTRFRILSTPEKRAFLRKWARTEAIPLVAEFAKQRDAPRDEATRHLGNTLQMALKDDPIDVSALTEKNPDYWRAMMSAPPRDPLVPVAQMALFAANGEFARAQRIAGVLAQFDDGQVGSSGVLADFLWMVNVLNQDLSNRIRKGIALNDESHFDEAEQVFDAVLKDEPRSAWAHYERFQTRLTRALKSKADNSRVTMDWPEVRKSILDADPLYPSLAVATGPDEAYDLLLRKESEELFKGAKDLGPPFVRYAEIARDIGQPGFAAILYWTLLRNVEPASYGNRKLIEDMLYCLESLGIKELKTRVPGDHATEFKRIDAERAKQKQASPAFRSVAEPPGTEDKKKDPER